MADFAFSELTPDLIIDALESANWQVASGLLALNSYENRVYQFSDEDGQKWVCKFYRPARWSNEQIQEEHDFALELAEAELPVVAPCIQQNTSLFHFQGFRFAVYPCRGGRTLELDNLDQLEWMGRFIGRIHAISSSKPFIYRPSCTTERLLQQATAQIKQSQFVPAALENAFFTVLAQVTKLCIEQYQPKQQIRLHGDCHASNILWTDNGPHFVDLDDCQTGPAIQDLWMMLSGDQNQQMLQLSTLLDGYNEFFSFEPSELSLIESLRTMRMVNYMAWLCCRWQDPAFPINFPWFNSQKYWEQQILQLKEQYAALQQPVIQLMPV